LSNDFQTLIDGIFVTNVDQRPAAVVVVNQIHAAADSPPSLVIKLDDVRENRLAFDHEGVWMAVAAGETMDSFDDTNRAANSQPDELAQNRRQPHAIVGKNEFNRQFGEHS